MPTKQMSYKRLMEVYQFALRKNGFKVTRTSYFVYCNGIRDKKAFDARLEFNISLIPYTGNDSWVEGTLVKIKKCLNSKRVHGYTDGGEWSRYQRELRKLNR